MKILKFLWFIFIAIIHFLSVYIVKDEIKRHWLSINFSDDIVGSLRNISNIYLLILTCLLILIYALVCLRLAISKKPFIWIHNKLFKNRVSNKVLEILFYCFIYSLPFVIFTWILTIFIK